MQYGFQHPKLLENVFVSIFDIRDDLVFDSDLYQQWSPCLCCGLRSLFVIRIDLVAEIVDLDGQVVPLICQKGEFILQEHLSTFVLVMPYLDCPDHDVVGCLHLRDGMVWVQVALAPLQGLGFVERLFVHALFQLTRAYV